ncbi:hypothetical protein Bbelb_039260 [Branchiostoma belcheri]|nr:hypothetical protein Bbelb_039260 [Branchiostoma belcheri]
MDQSVLGEVTRLIRDKAEPFNILIVGHVGVGKSSLINSSNMAVAQTWNELAPFGGGTGLHSVKNNTTHLTPFTMFKPGFMAKPIDGYQEIIMMWDFAGIENLTEEAHIELLGLVLEGSVPENTDLVHLLNDTSLTREKLDKKFPSIAKERRIHRVIMVCEANRDVPENLVQTVRSAAKTSGGRNIVRESAGYLPGACRIPTKEGDRISNKMLLKETFDCDHDSRCPLDS